MAIRVQIGVQSMERSPQYVDIYGRIVKLKIAKNRWFDIPFTREESLKTVEENKLIVACMFLKYCFISSEWSLASSLISKVILQLKVSLYCPPPHFYQNYFFWNRETCSGGGNVNMEELGNLLVISWNWVNTEKLPEKLFLSYIFSLINVAFHM